MKGDLTWEARDSLEATDVERRRRRPRCAPRFIIIEAMMGTGDRRKGDEVGVWFVCSAVEGRLRLWEVVRRQ